MDPVLIVLILSVVAFIIFITVGGNKNTRSEKILEKYEFYADYNDANLNGKECIAFNDETNIVFIGNMRKCKKFDLDEIKSVSLIKENGQKVLVGINIEIEDFANPLHKFHFLNLPNDKENKFLIDRHYDDMLNKAEAWVVRLNRTIKN